MTRVDNQRINDSWDNVVSTWLSYANGVLSDNKMDDLDVLFEKGFGGPEGRPFIMWTEDWVYFPLEYDGAETVRSVPRNPRNRTGYFPKHITYADSD